MSESSENRIDRNFVGGLVAGSFVAGLFHPIDRALYLSQMLDQPFLKWSHFQHPYQGIQQTLLQRSLFGGLYYFAQGELEQKAEPIIIEKFGCRPSTAKILIGLSAGAAYGTSINAFSAIKYYTWQQPKGSNFWKNAYVMWQSGRLRPFMKGAKATVSRDMAFGSTYELLRASFKKDKNEKTSFSENIAAASLATVVSSPLNYVRVKQYASPTYALAPTAKEVLTNSYNQAKALPKLSQQLKLFQSHFRIGWGTARVAAGMAVGQSVFDYMQKRLKR